MSPLGLIGPWLSRVIKHPSTPGLMPIAPPNIETERVQALKKFVHIRCDTDKVHHSAVTYTRMDA